MTEEARITLQITGEEIDGFCREIVAASSNSGRRHATLVALEGFIARFAGADSHSPAYEAILGRIRNFSEQTRSDLLREQAAALDAALEQEDVAALGRIHHGLSRNGFSQVAGRIGQQMPSSRRQRTTAWLRQWCDQAEQAARQASGWPDAMDFRAAGIDLQAYRAAKDILIQLTEEHP